MAEFNENHKDRRNGSGHRLVVRNGHHQERDILSSLGPVRVRQSRVDDRQLVQEGEKRFANRLLLPYTRKVPSIENLLPILHLKGISSQDFPTALASILGDAVKGLSTNTLVRRKEKCQDQFLEWCHRDLSDKRQIYIWADGVYFNVRLNDATPCILIIISADERSRKELLGLIDGANEKAN